MTWLLRAAVPVPSPSVDPCAAEVDPFGPLPVECAPEAPAWLFPVTMTLLAVAAVALAIGIVLWVVRVRRDKAEARARYQERPWVDLNDFNPRKDSRRTRSPKVVRDEVERDRPDDSEDTP